jgi:nanoRNase/pAp phosphatase (c-di-AMP/oligoRNAs hydrolase)
MNSLPERIDALFKTLAGANSVLILPHNDPDPDAIASAVALRHLLADGLGVSGQIAYEGIIGRAENKALVRYLGRPLQRLKSSDLRQSRPIALVDTQPGAGNNALPSTSTAAVVFDHHPLREETAVAQFVDVRPGLGATSTIMTEYLQAAGIEPPPVLATALFYGIKTDTLGLGRGAGPADVTAYFYLQPRIDVDALAEIERAQLPAEYFKRLDAALQAARVYENVVVSNMGPISRPDMAAEMADLLLRLEGTRWAVCIGAYQDDLILAVRTRSLRGGAGQLARDIAGGQGTAGGHGMMAGGQIPLNGAEPQQMAQQLIQRALEVLKVAPESAGRPLI